MGSTFLSEFMMISNINTVLFIVLLIGLFFVINKIKKSLNFTKLMLVSMGMGTILGFIIQYIAKFPKDPTQISWLKEVTTWYGLVGYGKEDDEFNPDEHEAIGRMEDEKAKKETLAQVYLKGYKLKDKVIRHAKVMVKVPKA